MERSCSLIHTCLGTKSASRRCGALEFGLAEVDTHDFSAQLVMMQARLETMKNIIILHSGECVHCLGLDYNRYRVQR